MLMAPTRMPGRVRRTEPLVVSGRLSNIMIATVPSTHSLGLIVNCTLLRTQFFQRLNTSVLRTPYTTPCSPLTTRHYMNPTIFLPLLTGVFSTPRPHFAGLVSSIFTGRTRALLRCWRNSWRCIALGGYPMPLSSACPTLTFAGDWGLSADLLWDTRLCLALSLYKPSKGMCWAEASVMIPGQTQLPEVPPSRLKIH